MSVKECTHHKNKSQKLLRKLCSFFLILAFIVLLTFLITWAILQPRKPRFTLQDATIFSFNVSAPILLSSNFQVTVSSHNPNSRIGVYYDKLNIYASYKNQQITYFTGIQPVYQGHHDTNVWSPFVYGTDKTRVIVIVSIVSFIILIIIYIYQRCLNTTPFCLIHPSF
ncbi:hypothetical protein Hanom_Chr14g01277571 [Helianthus anomalus]